jgi:hypothetical protein
MCDGMDWIRVGLDTTYWKACSALNFLTNNYNRNLVMSAYIYSSTGLLE